MAALEARYELLLLAACPSHEDEEEPEEEPDTEPDTEQDVNDAKNAEDQGVTRLLGLARARQALYAENEALRDKRMAFAKAHAGLQHLLDADEQQSQLTLKAPSLVILARRFSMGECLEASRVGYRRVAAYLDAQRLVPPPRSAMGWADRRAYADGVLRFCFSKTFAHRGSQQLADATWGLLTSPRRVQKLFSHYLNMALHVVQRLDVNNVVCLRTFNQTGQHAVLKSLFLLTRFETDRGFLILAHSLDASRLEDDLVTVDMVGKREVWHDEFTWMLVEDAPDGGSRFSYGGATRAGDPFNIFWGIEVLLIILRWETTVVAPLFTLRCN